MNPDFVYFIAPDSLDGSLCTFGLKCDARRNRSSPDCRGIAQTHWVAGRARCKPFTGWVRASNSIIGLLFKHTTN
jgi:hypothetical protein